MKDFNLRLIDKDLKLFRLEELRKKKKKREKIVLK
jgi:hypothetical protein